ncbi:hypothetical protein CHU98_g7860 [Xylaria longipes]|nr:hypothetical protein CHU98_g7860 [Xylaria longipes]
MAQVNKPVESEIANTIVETNNFHQVLEHFNSAGGLKHKETRLEIECQICLSKNLALVNLEQEKPVSDTHEQYVILPRCGHAFGHQCLNYVSSHSPPLWYLEKLGSVENKLTWSYSGSRVSPIGRDARLAVNLYTVRTSTG